MPWLEWALLGALWLAGLLTVGLWLDINQAWQSHGQKGWSAFAGVGIVAFSGLAAAMQCWRGFNRLHQAGQVRNFLVWNGQHWHCSPAVCALSAASRIPSIPSIPSGAVFVVLDLQSLLLVRLAGCGRWAWLWRGSHPGQWLALRRALAARVRPTPTV